MQPYQTYELKILENGVIEVLRVTKVDYNGQSLTLENWRTTLYPHDRELAQSLLPEYYYNICLSAWTEEVAQAFEDHQ